MIGISAPASFSRPADTTAYTAGDLVANSTTAGSVAPMEFHCGMMGRGRAKVIRAKLTKSSNTTANATFLIHLFGSSPTVANGDNGAFTPVSVVDYLGAIPVDMSANAAVGSSATAKHGGPTPDINFDVTKAATANRKLFGLISATGAYAPASGETFEVALEFSVED